MAPPRERRWPRIAIGYTLFLLPLAAITAFAFETADPAYQPLVLRLAVALLLGIVLLHIRSHFRGDPLWDPPSAFESAAVRERVAPKFDPALVKLRGELAYGLRSRSYFDKVLWPRLQAIARANGRDELDPPAQPRFARRGPSVAVLAGLIRQIEERK